MPLFCNCAQIALQSCPNHTVIALLLQCNQGAFRMQANIVFRPRITEGGKEGSTHVV